MTKSAATYNYKTISSPFIRTLETAAYFQTALLQKFGEASPGSNTGLLTNPNITVKLGATSSKIFTEGILVRDGVQKCMASWLDGKASSIDPDPTAAQLFALDGSYSEKSPGKKYKEGFSDVVQKHLVLPAQSGTAPPKQVIALISHSDGINTFLKLFGYKGQDLMDPCYCATVAVDIEAGQGQE